MAQRPIPVILDTDIGGDIDDTWALAFMLRCPELDVRLVVSDTGNTVYRAKLIARLLEVAGRSDVPVGIGLTQPSDGPRERQADWVRDYDLERYPGCVHQDGVQAIIDTIMAAPEPVTLVCIGPVPNIAEALRREPALARRARYVGMQGSVHRGHDDSPVPIAEYNVVQDIPSCQAVFAAPWRDMTITPLDSCGIVRLDGELYGQVAASPDPLARAVIENYRIWLGAKPDPGRSSVLFDTVAVYLAYSTDLLTMARLGIRVDHAGFTRIDPAAAQIDCALAWRDLDAFRRLLVARLCQA